MTKKFREHDVGVVKVIESLDKKVFEGLLEECLSNYKVIDLQYAVYPLWVEQSPGVEYKEGYYEIQKVYSALVLVVDK